MDPSLEASRWGGAVALEVGVSGGVAEVAAVFV
jgi:hypothetical protein